METVETTLKTGHGPFRIVCYDAGPSVPPDFALIRGSVDGQESVKVRIQSECITGHVLQSLSCDCYEQLQDSLLSIAKEDRGVLIYLRQEGRGIGLADKIRSYVLQKQGADTVEANLQLGHDVDERTYGAAAMILKGLNVRSVVMLTNNPGKVHGLVREGIEVADTQLVPPAFRDENRRYLITKATRMGHTFSLPE